MTFPNSTSLDGAWRLLPTDSFRQGFYPLDDDSWIEQDLPAHWQQHPLLERYAGKVVYRKRFPLQGPGARGQGPEDESASPTPDPWPPLLAASQRDLLLVAALLQQRGSRPARGLLRAAGARDHTLGRRREHAARRGRVPRRAR